MMLWAALACTWACGHEHPPTPQVIDLPPGCQAFHVHRMPGMTGPSYLAEPMICPSSRCTAQDGDIVTVPDLVLFKQPLITSGPQVLSVTYLAQPTPAAVMAALKQKDATVQDLRCELPLAKERLARVGSKRIQAFMHDCSGPGAVGRMDPDAFGRVLYQGLPIALPFHLLNLHLDHDAPQ